VINYTNLQWSPDGKSLGVSFSIQSIDGPAVNGVWPYHVVIGLYLVGADGSDPHVLTHTLKPNECAFGAEWNVQSGALASIPPATAPGCGSQQWAYSLPSPATTYTWGEQGQVSGTPVLTASATSAILPAGPVGNPDGGSSFSIWQPGLVSGQISDAMRQAKLPPIPTFSTSFLAWSPDGQYVLDVIAQDWRLNSPQTPVPSAASLQATGLAGAPVLPARDAIAADLSSQTPAHVHNPFGVSRSEAGAALAWSPSGRYVALLERIGPASSVVNPNQLRVVVFDTATAKPLVTLNPEVAANPNYRDTVGGYTSLRWSADGSHLLLFDGNLGAISVFGPAQLPKA
jgi:dipeptidyl aminopeptidase/acylaminoacyl peptidase